MATIRVDELQTVMKELHKAWARKMHADAEAAGVRFVVTNDDNQVIGRWNSEREAWEPVAPGPENSAGQPGDKEGA